MTAAPFFIVGSSRSGSTLLRMILTSHSRLAIPPETWYLLPLLEQFPLDRPLDAHALECAVTMVTSDYRWPDMSMDTSTFRRRAIELKEPYLKDLVEIVYKYHLEQEGKLRWGDKTPGYIKIVPQLANLFPDALFIHLLRDGRDVTRSMEAVGWYGPEVRNNTREWSEAVDCYECWQRSALADRMMTIRYEDLARETDATMRSTCGFLGERFEPQMLSWEGNVSRLIPLREMQIHGKLGRKPNTADVARWKREMNAWEILAIESFIGSRLRRNGYALTFHQRIWFPVFACVRLYCSTIVPATLFTMRAFRFLRRRISPGRRPEPTQPTTTQSE